MSATCSSEEMLALYRSMLTMQRLEIVADNMYKDKHIRGFCHLYLGQEAIAAGMEAAMTRKDYLITSYREHCQQLVRGDTPFRILAELCGKSEGCSKGKGGSMHMFLTESRFFGGNGIVGAQTALGAGLAFAAHYRKESDVVAYAMFGDGSANQGQLYEALNIAALHKLPLIYVCENNKYGMGTATARSAYEDRYYTRGDYVPGIRINGMDVLQVKEGMSWAKKWAIANGPLYVELDTYRYRGHSMSDPGISYRTRTEVDQVRQERDPIKMQHNRIVSAGIATEEELKAMGKEVKKIVDQAGKQAIAASLPALSEMYTHVLCDQEEGEGLYIRGCDRVSGYRKGQEIHA